MDESGSGGVGVGYSTSGVDGNPLQETTVIERILITTTDGKTKIVTPEEYQIMLGRALRRKNYKMFMLWSGLVENAKKDIITQDVSLLSSFVTRKGEFEKIYRKSVENCLKWVLLYDDPLPDGARVDDYSPEELDIYYGDIKIKGIPKGYDFSYGKKAVIPCMTENGGFHARYCHVLPALMLKQFIEDNQGKVKTTVICMGFGYKIAERWWGKSVNVPVKAIAGWVVHSEAFKNFSTLDYSSTVRRLCIWILQKKHVFMVVWEQGSASDVIYFADNLEDNPFRKEFMTVFARRIKNLRSKDCDLMERFDRSIFSCMDVKCSRDFACVSFMARCTAYLSTMEIYNDKSALKCIMYNADVKFHKEVYLSFESALFSCLNRYIIGDGTTSHPGGMCVWFPASMNQRFVNINDVCLKVFDPKIEEPENACTLRFSGMGHMFVREGSHDSTPINLNGTTLNIEGEVPIPSSCTVSSKFHHPPINQTIHLRSALSMLRECKELLYSASSRIRFVK